ncbi:hypothetical protein [Novosphingobium resinovorum]|uniref:hypothetical protein n=1 Tax=Novosphingobium resinovorum TaxID=158500 RepID=UPI002ED5F864|nr:hypothetical protein [Novosphingobium resinovorum]
MRSVLRAAFPTALFVLQALPAAAAVEPPPIEAYGELPRVEDAAISPNGDLIASVTRFGSERHVLVVDKDGNVRFNADTGEGKVRGIDWADDDTVLLTSSVTVPLFGFTTDKSEMNGTVLIPLKAGNEQAWSSASRAAS